MGLSLLEWTAPVPTLWAEHLHHAGTGTPYSSKLDEFEQFVERAQKFPAISLSGGLSRGQQLGGGWDSTGPSAAAAALEREGRVVPLRMERGDNIRDEGNVASSLREEGRGLSGMAAMMSVRGANWTDWRDKVTSKKLLLIDDLPFAGERSRRERLCSCMYRLAIGARFPTVVIITDVVGEGSRSSSSSSGGNAQFAGEPQALRQALERGGAYQVHLGEEAQVAERFRRLPLAMDKPEAILSQAHQETGRVIAFLHENVLDFIDEEAIDDAAEVLHYLSDADWLLSGRSSRWSSRGDAYSALDHSDIDPSQLVIAASGSIAARGVLFANEHSAPRRSLYRSNFNG
ncbi:hypothetical protein CBR_g51010 [Chara braunii]|uniref:Uncharacterized protein n=1 Tax=Chara braunii TaxID=69332 RepID=A0A388M874_CHABU|nr:hypothetical protein CBR_g51010 [Chara braunii]|eukprot:GBG90662.1 hypothetical protein CBR_g51010 [Chara braunii]